MRYQNPKQYAYTEVDSQMHECFYRISCDQDSDENLVTHEHKAKYTRKVVMDVQCIKQIQDGTEHNRANEKQAKPSHLILSALHYLQPNPLT
jgi:hypothetical protein